MTVTDKFADATALAASIAAKFAKTSTESTTENNISNIINNDTSSRYVFFVLIYRLFVYICIYKDVCMYIYKQRY